MPPASIRTSTSRGPERRRRDRPRCEDLLPHEAPPRASHSSPGSSAPLYTSRVLPASSKESPMSKLFDLTGRLALITGSSRGIGRAIAEGYVAAGARVSDQRARRGGRVDAAVKAIGKNAIAAPFDVTDKAAIEAAVAKIEKDIGPIDILVNNAGMQQARADRRVSGGRLAPDHGDQSQLGVLRHAGGGAAHDRALARQDRQHLLGDVGARPPDDRALHGEQGRGEDAHQGDVRGVRANTASRRTASRRAISAPS